MRPRGVATVLICPVMLLAGCGGSAASTIRATPTVSTRTNTVATTTTRTVTTPATTASAPTGAPYCLPRDLGIHFVLSQGAAGTLFSRFAFVNVSSHACRLYGYPGVSAFTATARRIPVRVTRDHGFPPRRVRLVPRRLAYFSLATSDQVVGPCYRAAIFRFIPPGDYGYERIAHRQLICRFMRVTAAGTR